MIQKTASWTGLQARNPSAVITNERDTRSFVLTEKQGGPTSLLKA